MAGMSDRTEIFAAHRRLLFSIAYHMLGSVMDAEDLVQEAYLRWMDSPDVDESPKAYLATTITRLCIDQLRSARVRREQYVGPWLPEPLLTAGNDGPTDMAEMSDSLTMAFLVVLENLSPLERAVFLLREVFDYDYAEIARIVGKSESNCRQLASRAKTHVARRRPRFHASREQPQRIVSQFMQTCATGDLDGMLHLLSNDIVLTSDGGGKVTAARRPIVGPDHVARFIFGLLRKAPDNLRVEPAEVNRQPAFVIYLGEQLHNVMVLEVGAERIEGIYAVVNPEKLRGLTVRDKKASMTQWITGIDSQSTLLRTLPSRTTISGWVAD
jgi:RNA polymerase sigma-70 factor (ECF subfamily)